jgi:hypothetical protein
LRVLRQGVRRDLPVISALVAIRQTLDAFSKGHDKSSKGVSSIHSVGEWHEVYLLYLSRLLCRKSRHAPHSALVPLNRLWDQMKSSSGELQVAASEPTHERSEHLARQEEDDISWHNLGISLVILIGGISTASAQRAADKLGYWSKHWLADSKWQGRWRLQNGIRDLRSRTRPGRQR